MTYHTDERDKQVGREVLEMGNLHKPRGRGYSLRMTTPQVLIGTTNPWTGKSFKKTLNLGLGTRSHSEAVRIRDVRIGQLRQLESEALASVGARSIGTIIDLSPENAKEWRELRAAEGDRYDLILTEQLERAEQAGYRKEARQFADVVLKGKVPLDEALEQYFVDRAPGNPLGLDPLKPATMQDIRSSVKHLAKFLGEGATLASVGQKEAFEFRTRYLLETAKLSPVTVEKHLTHLRQFWTWAISDRRILRSVRGEPVTNPWISEERGVSKKRTHQSNKEQKRDAYTAAEAAKLFRAAPTWGTRTGDIVRLALVSGVRADEVASLKLFHVEEDGSGFSIPDGKTVSARRFIPLVGAAQRLAAERVQAVKKAQADVPVAEQRFFPEWPQRPSNGKASSVSQWYTRFRRKTLGEETDGRLVMHSFRHTWATMARRAGLPRDVRQELGGWAKPKEAMDGYDHGLGKQRLREWQELVWEAYRQAGYLEQF